MNMLILPVALMITGAPNDPVAQTPAPAQPTAAVITGAPAATAQTLATAPPASLQADTLPQTPVTVQAPASTSDKGEIVVTGRQRLRGDPLERVNAQSYALTRQVDEALFRPVAQVYKNALPGPVRRGLHNVISNLREPIIFVNYLLQLKPGKAAETVGRFTVNSAIGIGGLFDVAKGKTFKLPFRPNGFANTLGYYGVKQGAFLYLPFVGPTTIRDFIGDNLDRLVLPLSIGFPFNNLIYGIPATAVQILDRRVEFDERLQRLRENGDPYAASRDFYLERRQAEIDELHGRHHELLLPENAPPRAAPLNDEPEPATPAAPAPDTVAPPIAAPMPSAQPL